MPDITLSGIRKVFGSEQVAVDDLDLVVPDGAFMCLLGPSGCGKTTTLRMISGLETPSDGTIRVGDRTVTSVREGLYVPPERRGMGLVFQNYALWPHLTVRKNIEFGLQMKKVPPAERRPRVEQVAEMLRIQQTMDRYPSQLSGGQQQRVALARMLAVRPDVLLLDEPLSNLDAQLRLEMRTELKRIHEEFGSTIVFVTHDQLEAMTLATHVAVMNSGLLEQFGAPLEIYDRPASKFVAEFVGSPPMNLASRAAGDAWGTSLCDYVAAQSNDSDASAIETVGIRPERIRLRDARPGDWRIRATVRAVLPTGSTWVVRLDVGESTFFLVDFRPVDLAPGTEVECSASPADLHVFDGEGRRMEVYDQQVSAEPGAAEPPSKPGTPAGAARGHAGVGS